MPILGFAMPALGPLSAAPSFFSHLFLEQCCAPLTLAHAGLSLGGGHSLDLQLHWKLGARSITIMHQGKFKNLGLLNLLMMPRRMCLPFGLVPGLLTVGQ